jgi:hypothetical protein
MGSSLGTDIRARRSSLINVTLLLHEMIEALGAERGGAFLDSLIEWLRTNPKAHYLMDMYDELPARVRAIAEGREGLAS